MQREYIPLFFALIRSSVCGEPLSEDERALWRAEMFDEIFAEAKRHDLGHLIADALIENGLFMGERAMTAESALVSAVYRYEQLGFEFGRTCELFEALGIDYMPLKGSVLRTYYPKAYMRTSCDIDILVHEADVDRASSLLAEKLGYVRDAKGRHDVSLYTPGKNHIEIHYDLVEAGWAGKSSAILKGVWASAQPVKGTSHRYEMCDDMFFFYHVAHMAKHLEQGGCGIRPFIDLWILEHREGDRDARERLLEKGGLLQFSHVALALSRVWLGGLEADALSEQLEAYIFSGGTYGTEENRITMEQQKMGGKLGYAMSKIFLPYDTIKHHYPILQKHRWLMPLMQVRRWGKLIFCGHAGRSMRELQYNAGISDEKARETAEFLRRIGL